MGAGHFGLGLGGHGADHVQPQQARPLRDDQANPASSGMQQHAVAGFEIIEPA
ncbi:hypothetical protein D3C81_2091850 [compost metagenome]